jgi:hypothetical protein
VVTPSSLPKLSTMRSLVGVGSVAFAVSLALAACSGKDGSEVDGGAAGSGTGSTQSAGGAQSSAGTISLGSTTATGGSDGNGGNAGTGGIEECAAANQAAELAPVYLVFLLDESGSMGDGTNGDRTKKWDPVTAALNAFFADAASTGITASLSLFPLNKNMTDGAADQNILPDCEASAYMPPAIMPTALPNATVFKDLIASLAPPNENGTPTFPALSGTIDYAKTLRTEDATRKVAVVMVTDGEPTRCGKQNSVDNTAMAAAAVAADIPTYVIGVGDSLNALNSIAESGGTDKAFIIEANGDAEKTRKDFLDAVNAIRGQAISCNIAVPAPPAGKKLDPEKVNVQFTGDGKPATSLKYGTECTGDTAWRYDNATAPKMIELCTDACSAIKGDAKGKLDVVFGCVKRDVVN